MGQCMYMGNPEVKRKKDILKYKGKVRKKLVHKCLHKDFCVIKTSEDSSINDNVVFFPGKG